MTIEDLEEYKKNAVEILRKNSQYATAKATEEAFDLLICVEKFNSIPNTSFFLTPEEVSEILSKSTT